MTVAHIGGPSNSDVMEVLSDILKAMIHIGWLISPVCVCVRVYVRGRMSVCAYVCVRVGAHYLIDWHRVCGTRRPLTS